MSVLQEKLIPLLYDTENVNVIVRQQKIQYVRIHIRMITNVLLIVLIITVGILENVSIVIVIMDYMNRFVRQMEEAILTIVRLSVMNKL